MMAKQGRVRGTWAALAGRSVRGRPEAILAFLDGLLVVGAYAVLLMGRYDLFVPDHAWLDFRAFLPIAVLVHLVANWLAGLYGPVWEHASMREAQQILCAGVAASVTVTLLLLVFPRYVPLTVGALGGIGATALFGVARFHSRLFAFRRRRSVEDAVRVVFVGAGESAAAILREIRRQERPTVEPVAAVDDDARKQGRWVNGLSVEGGIDDLEDVARRHHAEQILLAIPSADSSLARTVADVAAKLQLPLKVLPSVSEFVNGVPRLQDVRDLSIDDILGRQQVTTDLDSVGGLLAGKRILITGGGGSIGSEIARQVSHFDPARLVILDHDETHLFDAAARIDVPCEQALVDVRNRDELDRVFDDVQPQVVFHAAAHKHVPLLEEHPCQAVATNVLGTTNVLGAAERAGVHRLVFISTDKAVLPANVMGASKRVGEQLVLSNRPEGAAWSCVRFGNVLGSRGSVVPTFMRQIRDGGPVTVTHQDVTRYFMSIPEAVQLVLQSSALAEGGEVFMLDMGEPVRILDLASRMITLAGQRPDVDVAIEVTGLRPGEKLAEELSTPEEAPTATSHPKITQLRPPLLDAGMLAESVHRLALVVGRQDDEAARDLLFELAVLQQPVIRIPDEHSVEAG